MKKIIAAFLLFSVISLIVPSCKKYPDGPLLNVISRKERMANTWHVSSYYENGADKTSDFNNTLQNAEFTIYKEGTYHLYYKAYGLVDYTESGTWNFTNDDKDFMTNPSSGTGSTATHHILRLKEKELWYKDDADANGISREYHLQQ